MRQFFTGYFFAFAETLERMSTYGTRRTFRPDHEPIPLKDILGGAERLPVLLGECQKNGFAASAATIERMLNLYRRREVKIADLRSLAAELKGRLHDELRQALFFRVDSENAKYFVTPNLFGDAVAEHYAPAISDIEEAGKCLALARPTACVFHLMRVMELGLKGVAKALEIPYAPSWESYLRQINARIAEKHQHKDAAWRKEEPFFQEVAGDLTSIKIAWRNPTMHIVRKYSSLEAEQIFAAVRTFMQRLATRSAA